VTGLLKHEMKKVNMSYYVGCKGAVSIPIYVQANQSVSPLGP